MYPRTLCGRLIVFVCSLYGVTIVSLIVVTLTNLLEMDPTQAKAFFLLEKLKAKNAIREEATEMIGLLARLSNAKKFSQKDPKVRNFIRLIERILDHKAVLMNLKRK